MPMTMTMMAAKTMAPKMMAKMMMLGKAGKDDKAEGMTKNDNNNGKVIKTCVTRRLTRITHSVTLNATPTQTPTPMPTTTTTATPQRQ